MDLGNYTGGGAGFGTSTADQSMAASGTTGSVSSGFSGPSYDSTGGGGGSGDDVYSRYVAASKPRTGIQAIKDYFTGNAYDYGYQRSFGKDLTGIGGLLLGAINPVLGLAFKGYQAFKPELNLLGNSPTISSYLNNRRNLYAPDTINYKSIYTPPGGINNIRTNPNIINPNTIPDLDDPFYSNMLYAQAPARMPTSGYDLRQKEKDAALELYYQENPELRPPEQGSLFGNGITSIV
jgi:hypothetical protein